MASNTHASPEVVEPTPEIDRAEKSTAQQTEYATGKSTSEDARLATIAEHNLPLWEGIKTYRKAVLWSILVSSSIIMEVCTFI